MVKRKVDTDTVDSLAAYKARLAGKKSKNPLTMIVEPPTPCSTNKSSTKKIPATPIPAPPSTKKSTTKKKLATPISTPKRSTRKKPNLVVSASSDSESSDDDDSSAVEVKSNVSPTKKTKKQLAGIAIAEKARAAADKKRKAVKSPAKEPEPKKKVVKEVVKEVKEVREVRVVQEIDDAFSSDDDYSSEEEEEEEEEEERGPNGTPVFDRHTEAANDCDLQSLQGSKAPVKVVASGTGISFRSMFGIAPAPTPAPAPALAKLAPIKKATPKKATPKSKTKPIPTTPNTPTSKPTTATATATATATQILPLLRTLLSYTTKSLILSLLIGLSYFLLSTSLTFLTTTRHPSVTCYTDTLPSTQSNFNLYIDSLTKEPRLPKGVRGCTLPAVACPDSADCYGGYVRSCGSTNLLSVAAGSAGCELSEPHGANLKNSLLSSLSTLSINYSCNCWGLFRLGESCGGDVKNTLRGEGGGAHPMFKVEEVGRFMRKKMPKKSGEGGGGVSDKQILVVGGFMPWEIRFSGGEEGGEEGGERTHTHTHTHTHIGLTTDFANRNVKFPWSCYLQILVNDALSYSFRSVVEVITTLFMWILSFFMKFPFVAVGGSITSWVVIWVKGRRRSRSQERNVAKQVEEEVYKRLKEQVGGGFPRDVLKEDVLRLIEPDHKKRKEFEKVVWAKVSKNVKNDPRVMKFPKAVNGVPHEFWQIVESGGGGKNGRVKVPEEPEGKEVEKERKGKKGEKEDVWVPKTKLVPKTVWQKLSPSSVKESEKAKPVGTRAKLY